MARRFNPAPGWPIPPAGWQPPAGWKPDPSWPPAPAGWRFWVDDERAEPGPADQPAADQPPGAGEAPGWQAPDEAGPGFSAWVRDHKLVTAVAAVLIVAFVSWWAFGGSEDRAGRGTSADGGSGGPPFSSETPGPTPSDAFASETQALTAAINAALAATYPSQPGSPGGTGATGATGVSPAPRSSSAGVSVEALGRDGTPIFVRWNIDGSLTGVQAKDAARADAAKILTAVKSTADFAYSRVVLIGSYPVGGPAASQRRVVEATYQKSTLDGVDLTKLDPRKVFDITAGPAFLDPSMRY